jgi:hypothetical protein
MVVMFNVFKRKKKQQKVFAKEIKDAANEVYKLEQETKTLEKLNSSEDSTIEVSFYPTRDYVAYVEISRTALEQAILYKIGQTKKKLEDMGYIIE